MRAARGPSRRSGQCRGRRAHCGPPCTHGDRLEESGAPRLETGPLAEVVRLRRPPAQSARTNPFNEGRCGPCSRPAARAVCSLTAHSDSGAQRDCRWAIQRLVSSDGHRGRHGTPVAAKAGITARRPPPCVARWEPDRAARALLGADDCSHLAGTPEIRPNKRVRSRDLRRSGDETNAQLLGGRRSGGRPPASGSRRFS
jgi:hypothetical protein